MKLDYLAEALQQHAEESARQLEEHPVAREALEHSLVNVHEAKMANLSPMEGKTIENAIVAAVKAAFVAANVAGSAETQKKIEEAARQAVRDELHKIVSAGY